MLEKLKAWADERGYRVAWGPIGALEKIQVIVRRRAADGELDPELYRTELEPLVTTSVVSGARGLVMVAVPRPAHRVEFEYDGRIHGAVLPPTYLRYRSTFEDVRQDLVQNAIPGVAVEHVMGPLKSLAARLGLIRYGRNNIAYAEGVGSYLQLCAFAVDHDLPEPETGGEPQLLFECEGCDLCRRACPTGAIGDDRVLIRAHRCLTLANENEGAWPEWVAPKAHHCLLGCLACQRVCPANSRLRVEETGIRFTASETASMMKHDEAGASIESGVRLKLAWLGQPHAEAVMGRNLRALVDRR